MFSPLHDMSSELYSLLCTVSEVNFDGSTAFWDDAEPWILLLKAAVLAQGFLLPDTHILHPWMFSANCSRFSLLCDPMMNLVPTGWCLNLHYSTREKARKWLVVQFVWFALVAFFSKELHCCTCNIIDRVSSNETFFMHYIHTTYIFLSSP